jgi:hypothetical protein
MKTYFKGQAERIRVYGLVKRLSSKRGDETIPNEDVIDLAQAIKYIMDAVFVPDSLTEESK